jgi:hypothetical protein
MLFNIITETFPSFFPFLEAPSYLQNFPRMPHACCCFSHARLNESRATGPNAENRFCPTLPSTLLARFGKGGEAFGSLLTGGFNF